MTAPNGRAVPWSGVLVIWLVTSLAMLGILWGRLDVASFSDADDALRLQQVRDWLAGQSWFDVTQYRVAPPAGVPMHWTRIVDLPIAALIVMLRPLLGTAQAEVIASIAVPLLTLLATMMLAANLAARRFGPQAGLVAALLVTFALPVSIRMMPLRIDHHAWQYFLALAAFGSITGGRPGRGGALAALCAARWGAVAAPHAATPRSPTVARRQHGQAHREKPVTRAALVEAPLFRHAGRAGMQEAQAAVARAPLHPPGEQGEIVECHPAAPAHVRG